jgi:hypothetical protein
MKVSRFLHAPALLHLKKVSPHQTCVRDRELSVSKIRSGGGGSGGGCAVGSRAPTIYWTSSVY